MKNHRGGLALLALLLAALALRLIPWLANLPLHHDEALYGAWARAIADGSDPLLLIPWVDKPPLVLYLLAGSIRLFGVSEPALRAPGMVAGALTVVVTYGLARRLYGGRIALIAAALFTVSPFAILFAPTAFTDPWLTLFLVAAAWAALSGRPLWAGVLVGLACASKQQGVFAVPLVVALVVTSPPGPLSCLRAGEGERGQPAGRARRAVRRLALAVVGFALVFGAVTYWDSLRWHNRPSYWDQSLRTYGGVVLAAAADCPARIGAWAEQIGRLFGVWWLTAPVLLAALCGLSQQRPARRGSAPLRMLAGFHGVVAAYIVAYLLVHVAFTFQPWDRYLLPILPLICALAAPGLARAWRGLTLALPAPALRRALGGVTAGVVLYAAGLGVTAAIPVGSDVGAYRGVAEAARYLATQPGPATVYHDRLGWHLDYYLYGLPVTRSWFDSPQKLAAEAARVWGRAPLTTQWLALPEWEESTVGSLQAALAAVGFTATREIDVVAGDRATADVILYRLVPLPRGLAAAPADKVTP